ncbi:MAG: hypothetical protein Tsb009_19340 [Planctomycetaceae bacterium]
MRIQWGIRAFLATVTACTITGCLSLSESKPLKYMGDASFGYYKDYATQIEYPDVQSDTPNDSIVTQPPRRIRHPRKDEIRNLSLAEAIRIALANNKIIRERQQFMSPQNPLLIGPNQSNNSIYDPAIQETGVNIGNRGLNSALADFDANFTTTILWGRDETVQNNAFLSGGLQPGDTLKDETAAFTSRLEKQMADGGLFSISHNWNYSLNNVPSRLFQSAYTGNLQFDYRRPLWAGSGTEFTRVVGPVGRNLQNVPVIFQGVVVARINNDISLTSFEMNVRNMLKDVEDLYWDLALAYHTYHSEVVARDSALGTWLNVKANVGRPNVGAAEEALARDNYFEARARSENALAELYSAETQLRRILGMPVNDGKILRPSDEPAKSELVPDWRIALTEALTRRVELRRQKWNIKSLELQKKAAESLTKPRLDFVSSGRINAFGDRLFSKNDTDGVTPHGLRSAYGTLTQGDQTGWNLGVEAWIPLGFRQAHTQVRNFEIRLLKAKAALAAQENEISHELAIAFQNLDRWFQTAKTNFNRRRAAEKRVRTYATLLERNPQLLDLLLRAQISLSQADIEYHRSLIEYNKAIADLHFRKGTLLEMNNVTLAESLWDEDAYQDALRRAWSRSYAVENQHLKTEPEEFVTNMVGIGPAHEENIPEENNNPLLTPQPDQSLPPAPSEKPQNEGSKKRPENTIPDGSVTESTTQVPFGNAPLDLSSNAASIKISDQSESEVSKAFAPVMTNPTRQSALPELNVPASPAGQSPEIETPTMKMKLDQVPASQQAPIQQTGREQPANEQLEKRGITISTNAKRLENKPAKRFPLPAKVNPPKPPAEDSLFSEPAGFRALPPVERPLKRFPVRD